MNSPSNLVRVITLVSSLTLLAGYVIYSQTLARNETATNKKDLMMPSSKVLTQPVFSTRKIESGTTNAETVMPIFPAIPSPINSAVNKRAADRADKP